MFGLEQTAATMGTMVPSGGGGEPVIASMIGYFHADDCTLGKVNGEAWPNRVTAESAFVFNKPGQFRQTNAGSNDFAGYQIVYPLTAANGHSESGSPNRTFANWTAVFVGQVSLPVPANMQIIQTNTGNRFVRGVVSSGGIKFPIYNGSAFISAGVDYSIPWTDGNSHIVVVTANGTTGEIKVYFRGELVNTVANAWAEQTIGTFYSLGVPSQSAYGYNGEVVEHRYYDGVLSDDDRNGITNFLAAKYNVILT